MPEVLLFAQAREVAGCTGITVAGATVAAVIEELNERFGPAFSDVVAISNVWVNGEPAELDSPVDVNDEVAILPPVSGGLG